MPNRSGRQPVRSLDGLDDDLGPRGCLEGRLQEDSFMTAGPSTKNMKKGGP
jgi:hypothetical protein